MQERPAEGAEGSGGGGEGAAAVPEHSCPVCHLPLPAGVHVGVADAHVLACLARSRAAGMLARGGRQATLGSGFKRGRSPPPRSPSPPPPDDAPPLSPPGPHTFDTRLVGRRLAPGAPAAPARADAALVRAAANPADPAAVLARLGPGTSLGFLPAPVAAALAPHMDAGSVTGVATLLVAADEGGAAPLPVRVTLAGAARVEAAAAGRAAAVDAAAPARAARAALAAVVGAALDADAHLWTAEEADALRSLQALGVDPAAAYLSLHRSARAAVAADAPAPRWTRPASLARSLPGDRAYRALRSLVDAGLVAPLDASSPTDVAAASRSLTVDELRAALSLPSSMTRLKLIAKAAAAARLPGAPGAAARASLTDALGRPCVRLRAGPATALRRAERIFFLSEGMDCAAAAAASAGAGGRPPRYTLNRGPTVFADRDALLAYEDALARAAALDDALCGGGGAGALDAALAPVEAFVLDGRHKDAHPAHLPSFLARFSAASVAAAAASVAVAALERAGDRDRACALLRALLGGTCLPRRRGEWWTRLALNLEAQGGQEEAAIETVDAALADEAVAAGDRLGLQRRRLRLGARRRRWRAPPWAAAARREPREVGVVAAPTAHIVGVKSRFAVHGGGLTSVEDLALAHYAAAGGWGGAHVEGGLWTALFHLLLWDTIWGPAAPPGALRRPWLHAPLDVGQPCFYGGRRAAVDAALERVGATSPHALATTVLTAWHAHEGTAVAGVPWRALAPGDAAAAAACVGGRGVAAVLRQLAAGRGGHGGGLPDLVLWRVTEWGADGVPARGDARVVEVKGPRDRLSDSQRAWLAALEDAGVDCEVFKVTEPSGGAGKAR